MDKQTLQFYDENSAEYAKLLINNSISDGIDQYFATALSHSAPHWVSLISDL